MKDFCMWSAIFYLVVGLVIIFKKERAKNDIMLRKLPESIYEARRLESGHVPVFRRKSDFLKAQTYIDQLL